MGGASRSQRHVADRQSLPSLFKLTSLAYLVSSPLNKKVSLWSDSDRVSLKQVDSIVGFAYCQNDNKWMQRHVATKNLQIG